MKRFPFRELATNRREAETRDNKWKRMQDDARNGCRFRMPRGLCRLRYIRLCISGPRTSSRTPRESLPSRTTPAAAAVSRGRRQTSWSLSLDTTQSLQFLLDGTRFRSANNFPARTTTLASFDGTAHATKTLSHFFRSRYQAKNLSTAADWSALVQYNLQAKAPAGTPDSAANSHWRDAVWYGIFGTAWEASLDAAGVEAINRKITEDWMGRLRGYGPGGYLNEGDVMEPKFGEAYFAKNYERLVEIKKAVDPTGLFWAPTAVGSEEWEVQGQKEWLTLQTGRLCKKDSYV